MRIDPVIEPRVREALAASVAQESDRFSTAIRGLGSSDDEYLEALELVFNINAGALFLIDEGELPSSERIAELAKDFGETSRWSGVSEENVRILLNAIVQSQNPLEFMSPGDAAYTSFAAGGWLLAGFPLRDDMEWTDFLDAVLLGLEERKQAGN